MVPEEPFGLEVGSSHLWLRCLTFGPSLLSLDEKTLGEEKIREEQEEGGVGVFLEAMAVKRSEMILTSLTLEASAMTSQSPDHQDAEINFGFF